MANSWMKDFDLRALAHEGALDARQLGDAIAATFRRRGRVIPMETPLGLSDEFARDAAKRAQSKAFLGKNRLDAPTLEEVIDEVRRFVVEPLALARQRRSHECVRRIHRPDGRNDLPGRLPLTGTRPSHSRNRRRYNTHPAASIGQRTAAATASATPMESATE